MHTEPRAARLFLLACLSPRPGDRGRYPAKLMTDSVPPPDDDAPWFRWRDTPLLVLLTPVALFFGWHVAGAAMLIRHWVRIPYLLTMVVLYACLTIPIWILNPTGNSWVPALATIVILSAVIAPICLGGKEEIMNGANLETSAPAHILTCLMYMVLPAIDAAMQADA